MLIIYILFVRDVFSQFSRKPIAYEDIQYLSFKKHRLTNPYGRNGPRQQLMYVGERIIENESISEVICRQFGKEDDGNPIFQCKVKGLPNKLQVIDVDIECEGFEHDFDSYVLVNSCSFCYDLKLNN